ncbi:MAG: dihydroorotate dehydrogenase electron transfer subunit [Clostridiales bacterium]|nr:dihydroorotate dehydrogenase electron transfer subunit [Clostridiales bacterium]
MNQMRMTLTENRPLAEGIRRLTLSGEGLEEQRPGQFLNIRLNGLFLRRPISVCDWEPGQVTVIYRVVGRGTEQLAAMRPGETLDVLTGLGNGYDLAPAGASPLLIGGGVGVPPLYLLARRLREQGREVTAVLGFRTAKEVFAVEDFRTLGCRVTVTTEDGSEGVRGFVTGALPENYSYFYTCGPEPMLRAVFRATKTSGQFSFEERMGCGFGACMGCTCRTVTGGKRICREGPVLRKEEILWED